MSGRQSPDSNNESDRTSRSAPLPTIKMNTGKPINNQTSYLQSLFSNVLQEGQVESFTSNFRGDRIHCKTLRPTRPLNYNEIKRNYSIRQYDSDSEDGRTASSRANRDLITEIHTAITRVIAAQEALSERIDQLHQSITDMQASVSRTERRIDATWNVLNDRERRTLMEKFSVGKSPPKKN